MTKTKPGQQGRKTKEQQRRTLERKPDMPRVDADGEIAADAEDDDRAGPPTWIAPSAKASFR